MLDDLGQLQLAWYLPYTGWMGGMSAEELTEQLKRLRARAGNPSVRELARLTERQGPGATMTRSTLQDKISGKNPPRLGQVLAIVRACAEHAKSIGAPLTAEDTDEQVWRQRVEGALAQPSLAPSRPVSTSGSVPSDQTTAGAADDTRYGPAAPAATGYGERYRMQASGAYLGQLREFAFSPDGQLMAYTDHYARGNCAVVQHLASLSSAVSLIGHNKPVNHLAFKPDGSLAATTSTDWTIRVWDVATGVCRKIHDYSRGEDYFHAEAFSPDGHDFIGIGTEHSVQARNVDTFDLAYILDSEGDGDGARTPRLTFSSDGRLVAIVRDRIRVREVAKVGDLLLDLPGAPLGEEVITFSPDGQFFAVSDTVWNTTTRKSRTLPGHQGNVRSVAFNSDGSRLATLDEDSVRVWDMFSDTCLRTIPGCKRMSILAFMPNGNLLLANNFHLNDIYIRRRSFFGTRLRRKVREKRVIRVLSPETGKQLTRRNHHLYIRQLLFSPDGRLLAVGTHNSRRPILWLERDLLKRSIRTWFQSMRSSQRACLILLAGLVLLTVLLVLSFNPDAIVVRWLTLAFGLPSAAIFWLAYLASQAHIRRRYRRLITRKVSG